MSERYIGITIGPIFDTINMTSSPASLWAASYMFSSLTRGICEILTTDHGVKPDDIVTPYYQADAPLLNKNNGVGLFHDRIIFKCGDEFDAAKMNEIRQKAILKIAEQFNISDTDYLNEYISVASVKFEATNPILESAKLLDFMELSKPFVFAENGNPLMSLFTNSRVEQGELQDEEQDEKTDQEKPKEGKNEAVKKLIAGFNGFQLEKCKNSKGEVVLKSLSDISRTQNGKTKYKRFKYYAIVRADGDRMGKIIKSFSKDEEIRDFSETCLLYCDAIATAVEKYGGVTIFSGGDDLLAIMPCEKDGESVFHFISEANAIFDDKFSKYNQDTSLSFGVFIAYNKFPLYEALAQSADLLFGKAKLVRDCVAVKLQKHSGQSVTLQIHNSELGYFNQLLEAVMCEDEAVLLSAMHKISLFETAFNAATDIKTIENLFINTFDADAHKNNDFVHKVLPKLFKLLQDSRAAEDGRGILSLDISESDKNNVALTFGFVIRMLKFFVEKGEERR